MKKQRSFLLRLFDRSCNGYNHLMCVLQDLTYELSSVLE